MLRTDLLLNSTMSLLDETAGSQDAGPSNTTGKMGSTLPPRTRVKKRARRSDKTSGADDGFSTASTSYAAYAAPASEMQRYAHGKPASTKSVCIMI